MRLPYWKDLLSGTKCHCLPLRQVWLKGWLIPGVPGVTITACIPSYTNRRSPSNNNHFLITFFSYGLWMSICQYSVKRTALFVFSFHGDQTVTLTIKTDRKQNRVSYFQNPLFSTLGEWQLLSIPQKILWRPHWASPLYWRQERKMWQGQERQGCNTGEHELSTLQNCVNRNNRKVTSYVALT